MTLTPTMLPPGDYCIIDPCYILTGDRFLALSDAWYAAAAPIVLADPQTGALVAWSATATGDGVYADQDGHLYGVDSGTLACLPLAILDAAALATRPRHDRSEGQVCCGRLVTFVCPSPCARCDAAGVIRFGPIIIATGPTWPERVARWGEDEDDEDEA
jgi:hypothetical protein